MVLYRHPLWFIHSIYVVKQTAVTQVILGWGLEVGVVKNRFDMDASHKLKAIIRFCSTCIAKFEFGDVKIFNVFEII